MCGTRAGPPLAAAIKPPPRRHWCSPIILAEIVSSTPELASSSPQSSPAKAPLPRRRDAACRARGEWLRPPVPPRVGGARPVPGRAHGAAGLLVARHMEAERQWDPNPASAARNGKKRRHPPTLLRGPHTGGAQRPRLGPRQ
jgi:hypothetical protein